MIPGSGEELPGRGLGSATPNVPIIFYKEVLRVLFNTHTVLYVPKRIPSIRFYAMMSTVLFSYNIKENPR